MGAPLKTHGRKPIIYREELAEEILTKVSEGGTLTSICKDNHLPSTTRFYKWLRDVPSLREKWNMAKELKSHHLIDEALELSRTLNTDPKNPMGISLNWARSVDIRIKALMEMASRLNPKEYGPKQQISNVIPIQINTNLNLGQDGPASVGKEENVYFVETPVKLLNGN